jgi:hypothetical protein
MFFESQLAQARLLCQLLHTVNVPLGKPKGENISSEPLRELALRLLIREAAPKHLPRWRLWQ